MRGTQFVLNNLITPLNHIPHKLFSTFDLRDSPQYGRDVIKDEVGVVMEELLCKLVTMETSEEDVAREVVAREVVEKLVNDVVNDQFRITATCLFNYFI